MINGKPIAARIYRELMAKNPYPIAVICGRYCEFGMWVRENCEIAGKWIRKERTENAYMVLRVEHTYGMEFKGYVLYGTWWQRSQIEQVLEAVKVRIR